VVIPTFERPEDLRKCLSSIDYKRQINPPSYEIIVTDDSKSDETKKLVLENFPDVCWGKGKQNGPAGNRNAGVERSKGKWVVFIDDDCIADENYLLSYHKAIINNPNVILFEGKIYPDRARKTWAECCPENSNGNMFWTSNLCVKREIFEKVNGFDERFRVAYEDIDFAYRVNSLGYSPLFVADASVCHPWRTLKLEGNNWKPKGYEISELILFINKHPEADEHSSPTTYLRHLLRMLTTDMKKCIVEFKGRGFATLISQIATTFIVIVEITLGRYSKNNA
jgi:GT2 family glycosyltransferase